MLNHFSSHAIESKHNKSTVKTQTDNIWQSLIKRLFESPELRVWHTYDGGGNIWWSAYDPKNRCSICQTSEDQMRVWIEQRYR